MRFRIAGVEEKKTSVGELTIDEDDGCLCLYIDDQLVLEITPEGYLTKYNDAQEVEGLQCDDNGHIKEVEA